MKYAIRVSAGLIAIVCLIAWQQNNDDAARKSDIRQQQVSRQLSKLDPIEAANIIDCMAKFSTSENITATVKGQILECRSKRGQLLGSI